MNIPSQTQETTPSTAHSVFDQLLAYFHVLCPEPSPVPALPELQAMSDQTRTVRQSLRSRLENVFDIVGVLK